jgi:hypothetical protein
MIKEKKTFVTHGTVLGPSWLDDITSRTYLIIEEYKLIILEEMLCGWK